MKKIYLIATIVAILTGIVVFIFVENLKKESLKNDENLVPVVVTQVDIPEKQVITAEMINTVYLPINSVSENVIGDPNNVIGKTAKFTLLKGEQLLNNKVVEIGDDNNDELSTRIKKGYRAFTVAVSQLSGLAGNIKKGDKIDIISTRTINDVTQTSMIMQNINVISVGNAPGYGDDSGGYSCITLEVPAEDCISLNHEIVNGFIHIVLRGMGDEEYKSVPVRVN